MANQHVELLEQAEATVLGASLSSEQLAAMALARLSEEDFRRPAHKAVFRAIAAVSRAGQHGTVPVVEWLIDNRFDGADALEMVGGPGAIAELAGRHVSRDVFGQRLGKVAAGALRRQMHQAAKELQDACADWQTSEEELRSIAVHKLMDAQAGQVGRVVRLSDRIEQVDAILRDGVASRSVSTGWRTLDYRYKPAPGRWTLVGGVPGHGKTAFLDALLFNLCEFQGWRTLICSPEKQPIEIHMAQLIQLKAGRPVLRSGNMENAPDVVEAKKWVDENFGWLELSEDGSDVGSLLALARLEHLLMPFQGLVIDPWNELDHSRDRGLSETEHISQSLSRIRRFARDRDVHVWLVAHPTKLSKNADGHYPVPTPYDVSGSAHWRNKADNALAIWRDISDPYAATEVHVQKIRWQPEDGQLGMVPLKFDGSTGRFGEVRS